MTTINLEQRSGLRMELKSAQAGSRTGAPFVTRIRVKLMTKTQSVTRIRA